MGLFVQRTGRTGGAPRAGDGEPRVGGPNGGGDGGGYGVGHIRGGDEGGAGRGESAQPPEAQHVHQRRHVEDGDSQPLRREPRTAAGVPGWGVGGGAVGEGRGGNRIGGRTGGGGGGPRRLDRLPPRCTTAPLCPCPAVRGRRPAA